MSLLRRIARVAAPALRAAAPALVSAIPGVGPVASAALRVGSASRALRVPSPVAAPAAQAMSLLPQVGRVGGRIVGAAGTAGGIYAGVQAARAGSGGGRRRRAKGITGSEMKAFNRVTRILDKVCKTPAPTRRRSSSRSKSCR